MNIHGLKKSLKGMIRNLRFEQSRPEKKQDKIKIKRLIRCINRCSQKIGELKRKKAR